MPARILLIDDDERLAGMVATYLGGRGFEVAWCPTGTLGLERVRAGGVDAVVLDLMLPDLDGFEVCRQLRAKSDVPVLMLTARGDELDRIVGLELGADDYLPKPFNPRELAARLQAILRRSRPGPRPDGTLRFGRLVLDRDRRRVTLDGQERPLTSYQFELLWTLAGAAGRVLTREQLLQQVKGAELEPFDRSIDVHVSRIRQAVEDDPHHPKRIRTVRGAGYVFSAADEP